MNPCHRRYAGLAECSAVLALTAEVPPLDSFVNAIRIVRQEKRIEHANRLHLQICGSGLESSGLFADCLLQMFVDCGSLSSARQVFDKFSYFSGTISWISLVQCYLHHKQPENAFRACRHVRELGGVHLDSYAFILLLRGCAQFRCVEKGRMLHLDVVKAGLEGDLAVASVLVGMYSKCGAVDEAQGVFNRLTTHDAVLWTTLMMGFVECGFGEKALECFRRMCVEGVVPDTIVFVSSLKACACAKDTTMGQELHSKLIECGLELNPFIGNALVAMYGKCGLVKEAHEVFQNLARKDVVSWNALIHGYVEQSCYEDAICCLKSMNLDVTVATPATFVSGLKACCGIGDLRTGQELHVEIVKEGLEVNLEVGNSLLGMYSKCGSVSDARDVFDDLPIQDAISWTMISTCFVQHGSAQEALQCSERMRLEGVIPDAPAYGCFLKACANLQALEKGCELHNFVVLEGIELEGFVSNNLIEMYIKCGFLAEAEHVFQQMLNKDVVSWNVIISGHVEHGFYEKAVSYLGNMSDAGISPNIFTYIYHLRACRLGKLLERGQRLHSEVVEEGYESDNLLVIAMMEMYLSCGAVVEAQEVFDELPSRDCFSWTALLRAYAECGFNDAALECLQKMQAEGILPDETSWDALVLCHIEQDKGANAFQLYVQMQGQGMLPSAASTLGILVECGDVAALRTGREVHALIHGMALAAPHVMLANALIDMYCRCGSISEGQYLFGALTSRDIVTWNTLITGYARYGEGDTVFYMLDQMMKEGIKHDSITILGALMVCDYEGLVENGWRFFHVWTGSGAASTSIKHHHCMADLLGRAGQVNEAVTLLEKMPFHKDPVTWCTMLAAFKKWGHRGLGREAFGTALKSDNMRSGLFVLMSNMILDIR